MTRCDCTSLFQDDINAYVHQDMLRNPWEDLERQRGIASDSMNSSASNMLSDSMIPQVGDSLLSRGVNPAPDVESPQVDEQDELEDSQGVFDNAPQHPPLSDSLVPLVGDSMSEDPENAS